MKRFFLFFIFIGLLNSVGAQYFQTGQDPASLEWRQITTTNFQIIYPDYYEEQAQKLAGIMELVYKKGGQTLNYSPSKISIIIHTQTVKSNGLVAWAPKRSEFYAIPHQGIYPHDWLKQLAIHEFRHVVQIDKVNSELPKIIKILLGEQGTALVFGAYLPWWFIEGDAVVTETVLSNYGRGRFPSFLMEHKALAVEKGNYKYDKAYNGSKKDFVPDHYKLGYYLVGESRERYGSELWNSVLNRVGKKPFSFTPFNKVLKENTGLNKVELYNSVFDSLRNIWIEEDLKLESNDFKIVSKQHKMYTNYRYNHWLNDSILLSYKTALNKIPAFVKIDLKGNEKLIHHPGVIFDESVNYRDEWIVWSEQVPNPRWQHSGKSLIRLLNVESGKTEQVSTEFTAFAPSVSPNKINVVSVESDFSSNYYLSVYNILTDELVYRFQTEKNNYFFSPTWLNDKEIVTVVLLNEGKRLAKVNLETNKMELLIEDDLGELKQLRVVNNNIYFICGVSGKNELYKYYINNKKIDQIYTARFGVESPAISFNGKKAIVSDYTSDGFRLIEIPINDDNNIPLEKIEKKVYTLASSLAKQEPAGIINFSKTDSVYYESSKYRKAAHLFNFHSWAPLAIDITNYSISPGVSILSQNKLGTAEFSFGYEWEVSEKTGNFYGKYTFKGWYPVFDFQLNSGKSASEYLLVEQQVDENGIIIAQDTVLKRFTWNETSLSADVRIPFDFSRGNFSRFFQPEIRYDFTSYKHNNSTPEKFLEGNFQPLTYRLYYQQLLRRSAQDVFPNFGFILDGIYRHTPIGKTDFGILTLGESYLYLPGIMANHGIKLYAGVQDKKSPGMNSFSDIIRYPRGWGKINTNSMSSFAFDYKMPIAYPELSISGLVYLQRITTSIFADYATLNSNVYKDGHITGTFDTSISSFGIELLGDMNFLRFYAPLEIGFRASYLPKYENVYFDFLFSIDFNSL